LRQIERVFAFDVAGAHVIADGVADQFEPGREHECKLRFGNAPAAVAADVYWLPGPDDPAWRRLEEEFGTRRRIHQVVESGGADRFTFAGLLAAFVGDASRPDLLPVDGRQRRHIADSLLPRTRPRQIGEDALPFLGME